MVEGGALSIQRSPTMMNIIDNMRKDYNDISQKSLSNTIPLVKSITYDNNHDVSLPSMELKMESKYQIEMIKSSKMGSSSHTPSLGNDDSKSRKPKTNKKHYKEDDH